MKQNFDLLAGAGHLADVPVSGIRTIMNKAAALRAKGHDVIPFSAGEPSFNTPEHRTGDHQGAECAYDTLPG